MSLGSTALVGSQALLGFVGLAVGSAKVTHRDDQVTALQRFGYPQWVRIGTGLLEIGAGIGLIAGLLWRPELAVAGGLLFAGVLCGAVVTHVRTGDPPAKVAFPAILLTVVAGLLTLRYLPPV